MVGLQWFIIAFSLFRYTLTAIPPNDTEQHPAWSILEAFECGDSASDRIIGGNDAALGQLPWIVRLGYTGSFHDDVEWLCGGALLTDRFVITAAHCVEDNSMYDITHVRVGENDISRDPDCRKDVCAPPVQDLRVKNVTLHENFNTPIFHNDIALIELDNPAVLNGNWLLEYVAPVCLPRNKEQLSPLTTEDELIVAGWGKTNMTTEEMANVLQYLYLPVLDPKNCSMFTKRITWSSSHICAGGEKNKDACAGDSGGPLTKIFDTIEGPKHVLEAIVSFGPAVCGTNNLPGIYISVPSYTKWILDHIHRSKSR